MTLEEAEERTKKWIKGEYSYPITKFLEETPITLEMVKAAKERWNLAHSKPKGTWLFEEYDYLERNIHKGISVLSEELGRNYGDVRSVALKRGLIQGYTNFNLGVLKKYLTFKQIAKMLGVSVQRAEQLVKGK